MVLGQETPRDPVGRGKSFDARSGLDGSALALAGASRQVDPVEICPTRTPAHSENRHLSSFYQPVTNVACEYFRLAPSCRSLRNAAAAGPRREEDAISRPGSRGISDRNP